MKIIAPDLPNASIRHDQSVDRPAEDVKAKTVERLSDPVAAQKLVSVPEPPAVDEVTQSSPAQRAIADYRHCVGLIHRLGIGPGVVMVGRAEPGKPECRGYTYQGADGTNQVLAVIRTPDGQIPDALRQALEDLKLDDVRPLPSGQLPVAGATPIEYSNEIPPPMALRVAMRVAARFLRLSNLDADDPQRKAMQYATARYILNGTTDVSLQWLADHWNSDVESLQKSGQANPRWIEKIGRTLEKPFTNDQVMARLEMLCRKFTDAMQFVKEHNPNNSPVRFHAVGSVTKARFSLGSDMDTLIETDDPQLQDTTLRSEYGIIGAEPDTFAIRPYSFYSDRGPHFGTPVYMGDDVDELARPGLITELYQTLARRGWGVCLERDADGHATFGFTDKAGTNFRREAAVPVETLYMAARPYRRNRDDVFIVKHFDPMLDCPEARFMPGPRLVELGEALVVDRLESLTPERLAAFLAAEGSLTSDRGIEFLARHGLSAEELPAAVGSAGIDLGELLQPMELAELLGVTDPFERLTIDFAAAKRERETLRAGGEASAFSTEICRALRHKA